MLRMMILVAGMLILLDALVLMNNKVLDWLDRQGPFKQVCLSVILGVVIALVSFHSSLLICGHS